MIKRRFEIFLRSLFSILFIVSFISISSAKEPLSFIEFRKIYKQVDTIKKKELESYLRDFVHCCRPNRIVGSTGHQKVVPYLKKTLLEKLKVSESQIEIEEFKPDISKAKKMYLNDFETEIKGHFEKNSSTYKKWDTFTKEMISELDKRGSVSGQNLIWTKKAKDTGEKKTLIIGAHYDTISHSSNFQVKTDEPMPGADDNGSGVAIALSIIELLQKIDLKYNVKVVFFDWEEFGFLGSYAYVKNLKPENILGYINLEMLGNDTKTQDKLKKYHNMKVYIRAVSDLDGHEKDKNFLDSLVGPIKGQNLGVSFEVGANSFNSSDHVNFWERDIAAVTFTQDWENDFNKTRYHTSNDLPETLNMKTLYKSYQYIALGVLNLVEL